VDDDIGKLAVTGPDLALCFIEGHVQIVLKVQVVIADFLDGGVHDIDTIVFEVERRHMSILLLEGRKRLVNVRIAKPITT
jgi:hypothetical protein